MFGSKPVVFLVYCTLWQENHPFCGWLISDRSIVNCFYSQFFSPFVIVYAILRSAGVRLRVGAARGQGRLYPERRQVCVRVDATVYVCAYKGWGWHFMLTDGTVDMFRNIILLCIRLTPGTMHTTFTIKHTYNTHPCSRHHHYCYHHCTHSPLYTQVHYIRTSSWPVWRRWSCPPPAIQYTKHYTLYTIHYTVYTLYTYLFLARLKAMVMPTSSSLFRQNLSIWLLRSSE